MKVDGVEEVCYNLASRQVARVFSLIPTQIVLETEFDNSAALALYESLGFIREKRLYRFYLNGKDAFRLVLSVPQPYSDDGSDTTGSSPRSVTSIRGTGVINVSPYDDEQFESER